MGAGLNLLGMPTDLTDPAFLDFAAGRAWADAWTYDGCGGGFQWAYARPLDPTSFALPAGRGFWINGTASDSLLVLGIVPEIAQVRFCTGWNLVGLPGLAVGMTVQMLRTATGAGSGA